MRCRITNKKKIRKLREITGLPVIEALTRGNTGHRIDLMLEGEKHYDGWSLFPDGSLVRYGHDGKAIVTITPDMEGKK